MSRVSSHSRAANASLLRAFVFGVEDSVVSTVGLLSGVVVGDMPKSSVILAGVVLIFVEAFSMGAGEFLSESSAEDYERRKSHRDARPFLNGVVMFISYLVAGFIVLVPYLVLPVDRAFWTSIGVSLVALAILGAGNARIARVSVWKSSFRMFLIGGLALLVGILAANIFKTV